MDNLGRQANLPAPEKAASTNGSSSQPASNESIREDRVAAAIKFLTNNAVKNVASVRKEAFLKEKGVNQMEITEAYRRIGSTENTQHPVDSAPPKAVATVQAVPEPQQANAVVQYAAPALHAVPTPQVVPNIHTPAVHPPIGYHNHQLVPYYNEMPAHMHTTSYAYPNGQIMLYNGSPQINPHLLHTQKPKESKASKLLANWWISMLVTLGFVGLASQAWSWYKAWRYHKRGAAHHLNKIDQIATYLPLIERQLRRKGHDDGERYEPRTCGYQMSPNANVGSLDAGESMDDAGNPIDSTMALPYSAERYNGGVTGEYDSYNSQSRLISRELTNLKKETMNEMMAIKKELSSLREALQAVSGTLKGSSNSPQSSSLSDGLSSTLIGDSSAGKYDSIDTQTEGSLQKKVSFVGGSASNLRSGAEEAAQLTHLSASDAVVEGIQSSSLAKEAAEPQVIFSNGKITVEDVTNKELEGELEQDIDLRVLAYTAQKLTREYEDKQEDPVKPLVTLMMMLRNIVQNPNVEMYKNINMCTPRFRERFGAAPDTVGDLFKLLKFNRNDNYYVFKLSEASALNAGISVLDAILHKIQDTKENSLTEV